MKFKTKNFLAILSFIQSLGSQVADKTLYVSQEYISLPGIFDAYMPAERQLSLSINPNITVISDEVYSCLVSELPAIKLKAKGLPEYVTANLDSIVIDKYSFNASFRLADTEAYSNPYDSKEEVLFSKTYLKNLIGILDKMPNPVHLWGCNFIASDDVSYYSLDGGILGDRNPDAAFVFNTSTALLKKAVSYFDTFYLRDDYLFFFDLSDELFLEIPLQKDRTTLKDAQIIPNEILRKYKASGQYLVMNNLKDLTQTLKDLKPLADRRNLVRINLNKDGTDLIAKLQPYNELETTAEVEFRFANGCESMQTFNGIDFIFSLNDLIKYFDLVKSKEEVRIFLSNQVSPILLSQKDLKLDCLIMPALGLG